MIRDISEIQKLAVKYSKPQLARMAQMGLIDPTKAVMAGMMIDRITKSNMQMPTETVADEALRPVRMPYAGLQQNMPQPPVAPPSLGAMSPQMAPEMMPDPTAGVTALPSNIKEMAGGGIVAFDEGGEVPSYAGYYGSLVRDPMAPIESQSAGYRGGYIAPTADVLNKELQRVEAQINSMPSGRGRAALETRRNEIRSKLGISTPTAAAQSNTQATNVEQVAAPNFVNVNTIAPQQQSQQRNVSRGRVTPTNAPPNQAVLENQAAPKLVTEPVVNAAVQEEPMGIASIVPKRPDPYVMDPNVGKFTVTDLPVPKEKSVKDFLAERAEADKAAGVNIDIYKDMMKDLEGKRGKLAERKQEAIGNALMQTGLALLGSRKGQEFAVLGEAGQRSLQGLALANEKIRDTEDRIDDARRSLLVAENDYKRTRSDKALDEVTKHRDKIESLQNRNIEQKNAANLKIAEIQTQLEKTKVDARGQEMQGYGYETQRASAAETERSRRKSALDVANVQRESHLAGIDKQSESHLAGIRLQGQNQIAVQRMQNLGLNRQGETERLMSKYYEIEKTQGKEAAEKWLQVQERISGRGKASSTNLQEQYADDWNKMDVMQRRNMKEQGITTEQQYIDYRLRLAGRQPTTQQSNVPPVGTIQEWDGKKWRFKGGANTKENWEQVR